MADKENAEKLRRDVEHYEDLKRLVSDEKTLQALDKMIEQKKSQLALLTGQNAPK